MAYLERNAQIVGELNKGISTGEITVSKRGQPVSNNSGTTRFTPVGGFRSEVAQGYVPIGLKEYEASLPETRLLFDLTVAAKIADELPQLAPEVPLFIALLNKSGEDLGILTEDFSSGGRIHVIPLTDLGDLDESALPTELRDIIPRVSNRELAIATFQVANRRRIGDFTTLLADLSSSERRQIFPIEEVMDRRDEFIVKID